MNIQEYIESGIIETYVLGLASTLESAEFEQLSAQHPELVAARKNFEDELEKHASTHAVQPPVGVKAKVLEAIGDTSNSARASVSSSTPKIVTMQNESKKGSSGWLRFVAAASVVLLIGLAWFSYQSTTQNAELQKTNTALRDQLNSTKTTLDNIVAETNLLKDRNTTVVNMVGTKTAPPSSTNIYWDSASSNVYLVVKNMPKLPSEKQYQLWALIDGKPKDLGTFDGSDKGVILKMKNTQKAQAFAITIEKQGGSPSPTLDSMQSLGKTLQSQ